MRTVSGAIVLAAVAGAAVLALAAPAERGAPGEVVQGDGLVEAGATETLVCKVDLHYHFPDMIAYLVPEWTHVEKGQVVARLQRNPLLDVEVQDREAAVQAAQASVEQADAAAASRLAQAQGAVAVAKAAQGAARQQIAALQAQPDAAQAEDLALQQQQNGLERTFAATQVKLLAGLSTIGLCSNADMVSAQHDAARLAAQARYLAALALEQKPPETPLAVRQAEAALREADLKLQAARMRNKAEAARQKLLCQAARIGDSQKAQSSLDLTNKKIEALTMRAPRNGYVMYATRWETGMEHQRLAVGDTVWYGQTVASIVDASGLRIRARVDENDIPCVRAGDTVEVHLPANPGKTYAGKVSGVLALISTQISQTTATPGQNGAQRYGAVLVALTDADAAVRPGMTAHLTIRTSGQSVTAGSPLPSVADPGKVLCLRGQLGSRTIRAIGAPTSGRVHWIADEGTRVKAGDPWSGWSPACKRTGERRTSRS